jgi:hypothetical protein
MNAPIIYEWTGEAFKPLPHYAKRCDAELVGGERYRLEAVAERSQASHAHFFAELDDCWQHLPEHLMAQYPTPEHLRKRALIAAGHCDVQHHVCATRAEALRTAELVRRRETYSVVETRGTVLMICTARSQSKRAMPSRREWEDVKQKALAWIAAQVGVDAATLRREAGNAA